LHTRSFFAIAVVSAAVAAIVVGSSTGATRGAAAFHKVVVASLGPRTELIKGSPHASGSVRVTLKPSTGEACWTISVKGLASNDKKLSAYVHKGKKGKLGAAVIPLGSKYSTKGCVTGVPAKALKAIGSNPAAYYVNVYTKKYVHGAIRGQLRVG
jgi:CHRD domain-containing protein